MKLGGLRYGAIMLVCLSSMVDARHHHQATMVLVSVDNTSAHEIIMKHELSHKHIKIVAHTHQTIKWNIPYINIRKKPSCYDAYMSGKPYKPSGVITVKTMYGEYGLWGEETGIIGALACDRQHRYDECIPMSLLRLLDSHHHAKYLVALKVDKNGMVSLEKLG
jgi:hypothetical protein